MTTKTTKTATAKTATAKPVKTVKPAVAANMTVKEIENTAFEYGLGIGSGLAGLRALFLSYPKQEQEITFMARFGYATAVVMKEYGLTEEQARKKALYILQETSKPGSSSAEKPNRTAAENGIYNTSSAQVSKARKQIGAKRLRKAGAGRKATKGAKKGAAGIANGNTAPSDFKAYALAMVALMKQAARYAQDNAKLASGGDDVGTMIRDAVTAIQSHVSAIEGAMNG